MLIQIVTFPDCPGRNPTMRALRDFASACALAVKMEEVLIQSPEEAAGYDFHGSPTILIDGVDLDEALRGAPLVFGCRLYDGYPAPSVEWVKAHVQQWLYGRRAGDAGLADAG